MFTVLVTKLAFVRTSPDARLKLVELAEQQGTKIFPSKTAG